MQKKVKEIPEEFETYEEAAEFWETHDSTDYEDIIEEVEIRVDLTKRRYLIELDKNSAELLLENAQKKGVSASNLASEIIEKQLARAE
jgi:predicted RNA-binding protein with PUA domain